MNKNYFISVRSVKTIQFFCFLLVTFFSVSISSYGQVVRNHLGTSLPGSSTLEIPAGVGMSGNSIKVQTWGAGGGGGGPATLLGLLNVLNVGGGGGGGAFNEGILTNIGENPDNMKIAYTIGAGGAGGTSTTIDGSNGGNSFFSTVSANGGKGGAAGILLGGLLNLYASNGIGGQGAQGGIYSGGNGYTAGLLGQGVGLVSGAGGGGAGSGGNGMGSNAGLLSQTGGAGGIANGSDGGTGGNGGNGLSALNLLNGDGLVGGFPAGGGGGSYTLLDLVGLLGHPKGGNGANGQIKVTYTCPVYTVSNVDADPVCVSPGATVVTLTGFLPVGKYTVTYDVSSPLQTGLQAVDVKVATAGTLKFTVTGLTTPGTSKITIRNIRSVDCSTDVNMSKDVTVSPNLTAIVAITTSSSGAICYGTSVTFTAAPINGGATPMYQWRINGVNVAGANAATYTNSTLINGAIVTCVMTSNLTPCLTGNPATSNPITMTVSGPAANPVTVCVGGSGSLMASGCGVLAPKTLVKYPTIANNGSVNAWVNPNNVFIDDNNYVTRVLNNSTSATISVTGYDFSSIPNNATITNVEVSIGRYASGVLGYTGVSDKTLNLIVNNVSGGTNRADTGTDWPTSETPKSYSHTPANWGYPSLSVSQIKQNNFGVAFSASVPLLVASRTLYIDYINITITYTVLGVNWYTVASGGTPIDSGSPFNPVGVSGSGLANTNIAGEHTFYAACSTAPTCRTPVKFIISGTPVIAAISPQATLCSGGILTPEVPAVTTNNSVITASGWQLETAVGSNSYVNLTVPYTVSFADNNKRIRYYVSTNCAPAIYSNVVPITVNSVPAPVIGEPTVPICTQPTATVIATGLSGSWIINATPNVGLTGLTGSGTTATISGLTPGTTYSFTFSNGSCTSSAFSVTVNELATITWNGSWSGTPTIDKKVVFAENYNEDLENLDEENVNIEACSCEVKSGAIVVFRTGRYLKIRNELKVDPEGSLTFENNASLVQINHVKNSGVISYKRITKPVNRYDYTYWSSPVVGMTLKQLSPGTFYDKYFKYDNAWISIINETTMDVGEGYIVRAPQIIAISGNPANYPAIFKGIPSNDEVKKNLVANRVYLLGNPYPSAISAKEFLKINETKLQGTLYFWTHNSPPSEYINGDKKYNYLASDYATYNRTGGTATTPNPNFNYSAINTNIPNGNIAATQGFFAQASAAGGEIIFNNSMRLTDDEIVHYDVFVDDEVRDNSQFFKLGKTVKSVSKSEENRVWLNLTNDGGVFKQALIGYITGASNGYEGSFDGISYDGNIFVDFYSVNNNVNLTIQGRALPFEQKDSIALGYRSTIKGEFKISIDQKDGVLKSHPVFIEDKLLQVLHDLKTPYSFETEVGTFNDRFVLRYEDKNEIIEDVDAPVTAVSISTKDKNIKIATTESVINKIYIYDFSGSLVYSDSEINAVNTVVSNLLIDHSALIVHVVLENGKKTVKKIMY